MTFPSFELEYEDFCRYDVVLVIDADDKVLNFFCGRGQNFHFLSSAGKLTVAFITDASNGGRGFQGHWQWVDQPGGCKFTFRRFLNA